MSEAFDREKLIREKIGKTEERAVMSLSLIREIVLEYLLGEKGYSREEIETDRIFDITVDGRTERTAVDYLMKIGGKRFMAIKCSPGALESRERHLISFARVVDAYQIPYALVTDGFQARLLDTITGKLVSEGLDSIPEAAQARDVVKTAELIPYPAERMEKEKRILLAFESIKCTEESCE
ncbi:MAG TPA: type I restriction enzyme HsdR N-terminal domain-containing protein [Thermodesulfovibrionales bacterium]|nr:type I restriction enzyme HsdR N-terminal domain-containing protein [Thermodesulfovibrionales bacterium]